MLGFDSRAGRDVGELAKLSRAACTIAESLFSFQRSSAATLRPRRFLDRIDKRDSAPLAWRKKKFGISRGDAGMQRKSRGTRDKGIWLSQRAQRLCGRISETSEPTSSLYPPEARQPVTCAVTNYFPAFYRCSVRCPQRRLPNGKAKTIRRGRRTLHPADPDHRCSVRCPQRSQPRYIALPIVQESGAPRFAAYPRLSCSDFFPISFRTILSPRRQDRKGSNDLALLRQIGFMLCLVCFAPWQETFFPTS